METAQLRKARLAVSFAFIINGGLLGCFATRVPDLLIRWSVDKAAFSLALFAMAGGALIAFLAGGLLMPRLGSRTLLRWATLISPFLLLPILIAGQLWTGIIALFAFGLAQGFMDLAMNQQASDLEDRYPFRIMSGFHALWSLGGLIMAGLTLLLRAGSVSMEVQFLAVALVAIMLAHWCKDRFLADAPSPDQSAGAPQPLRLAVPTLPMLLIGLAIFAASVAEGTAIDWSAVYMRELFGGEHPLEVIALAAFSAAMIIARLSGDRVMERIPGFRVLEVGGVVSAALLSLAIVSQSIPLTVFAFSAIGLGIAVAAPIAYGAGARDKTMPRGLGLSVVTTMGYGGFLLGAPVIGSTAEAFGLDKALWIVVVMLLVMAGTGFLLQRLGIAER